MAAPDEVTLGEIYRALQEHKRDTANGFKSVNARISGLNVVHKDTYEEARAADVARIGRLEESSQWARRAIIGGLIALLATMGGNVAYLVGHAAATPAPSQSVTHR